MRESAFLMGLRVFRYYVSYDVLPRNTGGTLWVRRRGHKPQPDQGKMWYDQIMVFVDGKLRGG